MSEPRVSGPANTAAMYSGDTASRVALIQTESSGQGNVAGQDLKAGNTKRHKIYDRRKPPATATHVFVSVRLNWSNRAYAGWVLAIGYTGEVFNWDGS